LKKTQITFSFDEEKLNALKIYLSQKGLQLEDELEKATETIYSKAVPVSVREYIDVKNGNINPAPKKRKKDVPSSAVGASFQEVPHGE